MLIALGVLMVGVAVLMVVLSIGLGRWSRDETLKEDRLHAPETHTVSYVLTDGEDPVGVIAALTHAGFTSVEDLHGRHERVVVECDEDQRDRVRDVIAHVRHQRYDGSDVRDLVVFEDER